MIAVKNPLILYWLHTSRILDNVRLEVEERWGVEISLEGMRVKVEGEVPGHEIAEEINKEVEEEMGLYKIECVENLTEEGCGGVREMFKEYWEEKLWLVNSQTEAKGIKGFLESNKLTGALLEFENYYELQNVTYVFVKESISEEVLRVALKNELNDSLNEETIYYNKPDIKIEDVTLGVKIGEFEGGELWNCKHKSIPHTYIKFKDVHWEEGAKKRLLHYSNPNYFESTNLFAPMELLRPSRDKLAQLLSFLKVLEQKYPHHNPTCDSIFETQGKLVIFTKQNSYKLNKGWLCYHVVYGLISYQGYLRWVRHNPTDEISRHNEQSHTSYSMQLI